MPQFNPYPVVDQRIRTARDEFITEFGREPNILLLGQIEIAVLIQHIKAADASGEIKFMRSGHRRWEYAGIPVLPSGNPNGVIPALWRERDLPAVDSPDSVKREQSDSGD